MGYSDSCCLCSIGPAARHVSVSRMKGQLMLRRFQINHMLSGFMVWIN